MIKINYPEKKLIIFNPSIEDGGVEKNLFIIANYISQKIRSCILITSTVIKKKFSRNVKIITPAIKINKNLGRKIKYFFCIVLLIKEIVSSRRNCSVLSFQANIYAIIVCYIFKIKIISRSNSSPSGWSKSLFKKFIFNIFLKKANYIVVNSKEFQKEFKEKFNIKTVIIYNPFDFKLIKRQAREKINNNLYKKNQLNILSIGRLTEQKDHLTLIKAINLASKKIDINVIIIGKGYLKEKLNLLIKSFKLERKIRLIGYKKNPYKYIKKFDVFVLSSTFEGHPNVLVEALFLKKYIISSNCPTGPKEILKNGKFGKLFPTKDYIKLSKLLIKSKNNYKNKININNKNFKMYNLQKNCEEYLCLIKKII
jgi:glycosyltransferase involved in cell wall biosynthesis